MASITKKDTTQSLLDKFAPPKNMMPLVYGPPPSLDTYPDEESSAESVPDEKNAATGEIADE